MTSKNIEFGNIRNNNKKNGKKSWFFGRLDDQTLPYPWHYGSMQMKLHEAKKGESKRGGATTDPDNRTISILIKGKHKVIFPDSSESHTLEQKGDYVFFEPGVKHDWKAGDKEGSLTLTLRWKNDAEEIISYFTEQYPNKKIIKLPPDKPTEIICELEPSSEHPEYSIAVAAISLSKPHYHKKTTETYEIVRGKLTLTVNGKPIELNTGDTYTVQSQQIHHAKGGFTLVKVISRPGWTSDDHILVES